MSTERTITLRKRMAASKCKDKEGREVQFLGSGYLNRWKNGKGCSCSPDALFISEFLPDLKFEEGEVDVDLTLSLDPVDGGRQMWVFGLRLQSRMLTPFKPKLIRADTESEERDRADTWSVKGSECYLDGWCDQAYFEQIPVTPEPFPVWATVKRVQPESVVSSEKNL